MLGRMRTAYLSRTPLSAAVMLADEPNMEERQPGSWKCCVMRHRASRGASCAANNAVRPRRRCRAQTAAACRCHGSGGRRGLLAAEDLCAPLSYLFPTVCPPGCRPPSRPPRARDYGRVPRRTMFPLAREALRGTSSQMRRRRRTLGPGVSLNGPATGRLSVERAACRGRPHARAEGRLDKGSSGRTCQ